MPFTKQAWVMKGNKTQLNCKQQGALWHLKNNNNLFNTKLSPTINQSKIYSMFKKGHSF
jgi:hypothetical protein